MVTKTPPGPAHASKTCMHIHTHWPTNGVLTTHAFAHVLAGLPAASSLLVLVPSVLENLTVDHFYHLDQSRADAPCSWRSLQLEYNALCPQYLAYLPLHSLTRFEVGN